MRQGSPQYLEPTAADLDNGPPAACDGGNPDTPSLVQPGEWLYQTTDWWNSANALTVLIDYARVANTHQYHPELATTFTAARAGTQGHPGFLNRYYDDEGWWALAWIDAYDLTGRRVTFRWPSPFSPT